MWVGEQKETLPLLCPEQAESYYREHTTSAQNFSTDVYSNGDEPSPNYGTHLDKPQLHL